MEACDQRTSCGDCVASLECYWCPDGGYCVFGQPFCSEGVQSQCGLSSEEDFNSVFAVIGLGGVFVVVIAVCIFGCFCTPDDRDPRENLLEQPEKGQATVSSPLLNICSHHYVTICHHALLFMRHFCDTRVE